MSTKSVSSNAGGKPARGFSLQHKTFSALNYAQDFGTTVKQSLKRTASSKWAMECFHITSRRPYWCPKTMSRRPCWCSKLVLLELNSFLVETLSFVPINLHRCGLLQTKTIGLIEYCVLASLEPFQKKKTLRLENL